MLADEQYSRANLSIKLDLAILNCQKHVSMLSHDSGDIKNIENGLITKKIYTFEIRRNLYNFDSFYSIGNILSVKNYIFK